MNKRERIKTIIEVLRAVTVLEWNDKNFLCTPQSLNSMKREFLEELDYLTGGAND